MSAAVDARILSSMKSERVLAAKALACPNVKPFAGDRKEFIKAQKLAEKAETQARIKEFTSGEVDE